MGSIRLLSEQLINRIAAGEVIERPAAVLKELLENSLDAGATRIEVEARSGGSRLVSVADNGHGMGRDDLLLAIERHATSKLGEETDLLHIDTLGFRGEALPSIGAVSRMTITSAAAQDGHGWRVRVSGGRIMGVDETGRDQGTSIEVEDLFFNVPARRKFLKSRQTEAAHLLETIHRYALAGRSLRLVYRHDGQELLSISPQEDDRTRLAKVLGRETARGMFPFEGQGGAVALSGFLGLPEADRSRPSAMHLFVNGRPVRDRLLSRAVLEGYRSRLGSGRYPAVVVYLAIDPGLVDVNVHPAKAEVRFRQPGEIYGVCADIVARALSGHLRPVSPGLGPVHPHGRYGPGAGGRPEAGVAVRETAPSFHWNGQKNDLPPYEMLFPAASRSREGDNADTRIETAPGFSASGGEPAQAELDQLKPIGQLFRSYILAQGPDGLYVVDQHAAHERILYEKLHADLSGGSLPSQHLLLPETFELTPTRAAVVEEVLPALARFGFDLEPFGGQTFVLRSVPGILAGRDVLRIVGDLLENSDSLKPDAGLEDLKEAVVSTLACHAAVKAGDGMTVPEMENLLARLNQCRVPTNCPHGRPLVFSITLADIEKRFKRA